MEPKSEEAKEGPKVANGALQNGTSSPDSGHPSSRNFSVTSGLSDGSLSTEDSTAPFTTLRSISVPQPAQSPVKTPAAKSEGLPEESQVQHKEEGEGAPHMSNIAKSASTGMTEENMIQCLEEKTEKKSKAQETVEESGAINTKETDHSSQPQEALLAERKENASVDPMAPEVERNLIFSAESGVTSAKETNFSSHRDDAQAMTESDESPSAIEMEEIPKAKVSMVPWSRKGRCEASSLSDDSHMELRQEEQQQGKASPECTESFLSEEPEMESLYQDSDSKSRSKITKNEATTREATGTTFSVSTCILLELKLICSSGDHLCQNRVFFK